MHCANGVCLGYRGFGGCAARMVFAYQILIVTIVSPHVCVGILQVVLFVICGLVMLAQTVIGSGYAVIIR